MICNLGDPMSLRHPVRSQPIARPLSLYLYLCLSPSHTTHTLEHTHTNIPRAPSRQLHTQPTAGPLPSRGRLMAVRLCCSVLQCVAVCYSDTYDMIPSHVTWIALTWHGSFSCDMTRLIHKWHVFSSYKLSFLLQSWVMRHDSLTCAMTHSHVTWSIHTRHDSFSRDMTHSLCHDLITCTMTYSNLPWRIHVCHDSFIVAMTHSRVRWLRLVDSIKLYVSCEK